MSLVIQDLEPDVVGCFAVVRCETCRRTYRSYLPTVAGLPIARLQCQQCGTVLNIQPTDLKEILKHLNKSFTKKQAEVQLSWASRMAESWYRKAEVAELVTHKNVNLGEAAERELLGWFAKEYPAEKAE